METIKAFKLYTEQWLSMPVHVFDSFVDDLVQRILQDESEFRTTEAMADLKYIYYYIIRYGFVDNYLLFNGFSTCASDVLTGERFREFRNKNDHEGTKKFVKFYRTRILKIQFMKELAGKHASEIEKKSYEDFDDLLYNFNHCLDFRLKEIGVDVSSRYDPKLHIWDLLPIGLIDYGGSQDLDFLFFLQNMSPKELRKYLESFERNTSEISDDNFIEMSCKLNSEYLDREMVVFYQNIELQKWRQNRDMGGLISSFDTFKF